MRNYAFGRVALVACIVVAAVSAQGQNYLLRTEGAVTVNGVAVPSTVLISAGDVIQTGKGGSAKIAAPGMAVLLAENSQVSLTDGALAINQGSASVTSTGRIATVSSQYAIKPVGTGSARYVVSNVGGSLTVTPWHGELAVVASNTVATNVLTGQKASFTAGKSKVSSVSNETLVEQRDAFSQLMGPYSSNLCRTAASCYCKTAARCPNKQLGE